MLYRPILYVISNINAETTFLTNRQNWPELFALFQIQPSPHFPEFVQYQLSQLLSWLKQFHPCFLCSVNFDLSLWLPWFWGLARVWSDPVDNLDLTNSKLFQPDWFDLLSGLTHHTVFLVQAFVALSHKTWFFLVSLLYKVCFAGVLQQELRQKQYKQCCQEWWNWCRKPAICSMSVTKTWHNSQGVEKPIHRELPEKLTPFRKYFSGISRSSTFSQPDTGRQQTCWLAEQILQCRSSARPA